MRKTLSLAVAAALSLSVAGTALPVSAANPFVDVPANHWAYDAVAQLQKDGVISGYGDGSFRGDRTLTRYEMAAMIAKITNVDDKNSALVKKLQSEFGNELYNMGVRVDALEKNASTIKFSGHAHIRYLAGMALQNTDVIDDGSNNPSRFDQRIHLDMKADVNDNWAFYGRLRAQNNTNTRDSSLPGAVKKSSDSQLQFYRAEFAYTNKNFTTSIGRINPTLGQGLIWDGERADGILMGYQFGRANLAAGYVDLRPTYSAGTMSPINAFIANLDIGLSDRVNFTAAYLDSLNPQDTVADLGTAHTFKQWAVGGNASLGSDFTLTGEYVQNDDAPDKKKGAWGKIQWKSIDNAKPGTYTVYAEYMKLGGWAIDSEVWGHTLNVAGGNGLDGAGAKGWGLGFQFVPAKNINMNLAYYDLKPMHETNFDKYKKSYVATTNFYF